MEQVHEEQGATGEVRAGDAGQRVTVSLTENGLAVSVDERTAWTAGLPFVAPMPGAGVWCLVDGYQVYLARTMAYGLTAAVDVDGHRMTVGPHVKPLVALYLLGVRLREHKAACAPSSPGTRDPVGTITVNGQPITARYEYAADGSLLGGSVTASTATPRTFRSLLADLLSPHTSRALSDQEMLDCVRGVIAAREANLRALNEAESNAYDLRVAARAIVKAMLGEGTVDEAGLPAKLDQIRRDHQNAVDVGRASNEEWTRLRATVAALFFPGSQEPVTVAELADEAERRAKVQKTWTLPPNLGVGEGVLAALNAFMDGLIHEPPGRVPTAGEVKAWLMTRGMWTGGSSSAIGVSAVPVDRITSGGAPLPTDGPSIRFPAGTTAEEMMDTLMGEEVTLKWPNTRHFDYLLDGRLRPNGDGYIFRPKNHTEANTRLLATPSEARRRITVRGNGDLVLQQVGVEWRGDVPVFHLAPWVDEEATTPATTIRLTIAGRACELNEERAGSWSGSTVDDGPAVSVQHLTDQEGAECALGRAIERKQAITATRSLAFHEAVHALVADTIEHSRGSFPAAIATLANATDGPLVAARESLTAQALETIRIGISVRGADLEDVEGDLKLLADHRLIPTWEGNTVVDPAAALARARVRESTLEWLRTVRAQTSVADAPRQAMRDAINAIFGGDLWGRADFTPEQAVLRHLSTLVQQHHSGVEGGAAIELVDFAPTVRLVLLVAHRVVAAAVLKLHGIDSPARVDDLPRPPEGKAIALGWEPVAVTGPVGGVNPANDGAAGAA